MVCLTSSIQSSPDKQAVFEYNLFLSECLSAWQNDATQRISHSNPCNLCVGHLRWQKGDFADTIDKYRDGEIILGHSNGSKTSNGSLKVKRTAEEQVGMMHAKDSRC